MSNIADSLTGLVGNTPLLALNKYAAKKMRKQPLSPRSSILTLCSP
jgi:hypothetical protein